MLSSRLNKASSSLVDWSNYDSTKDKSAVTFSNYSGVKYVTVVPIDSSRSFIVYNAENNHSYARIMSVDGKGDIIFGAEVKILAQQVYGLDAKLVDSKHLLVVFDTVGVKSIIVPFSGTTIGTLGTAVTFASSIFVNDIKCTVISETEFFILYENGTTTELEMWYGSISGTTITKGNKLVILSSDTSRNSISNIGNGKAIIAYNDQATSQLDVKLISVDDSSPVVEDSLNDIAGNSENTAAQQVVMLKEGKALLVYENLTPNPDSTEAVIIYESSGVLNKGLTEVVQTVANPEYVSISLPDYSHAVVSQGFGPSTGIRSNILEISGNSLNALDTYINNSGDNEYVSNGAIGNKFIAVAYTDDDDSSKGKVIIMRV